MRNPFVRLLVLAGALLDRPGCGHPDIAPRSDVLGGAPGAAGCDLRLPRRDVALAGSDEQAENADVLQRAAEQGRRVPALGARPLARPRRQGRARRAEPAAPAAWLCIHRFERHPGQGWATRTGNGYYGGLQMDISFQRTYGGELLRRKGTANRWTRGRADVGRRARLQERARLLSVAEHGPLLRPDLGLVVVTAGAAAAPLPQLDREEDARDRDASSASTIAPPTPPWARNGVSPARAATSHRPCRRPSGRAWRTGTEARPVPAGS